MDTGVARPIAQGQAMIRTATALTSAIGKDGAGPKTSQTRKVATARPITAGTNHSVTLSTSAWIGSLPPWAASTMRMIRDSMVSAPTDTASITKAPVWFTVPPITRSPACFSTGKGSPVTIDSSIQLEPSATLPSTGTRSPGRSSSKSPGRTSATGISRTCASRRKCAIAGCRPTSRSMALDDRPLARASSRRPRRIRVTITAAASK